jgi:hypothetical protein
MFHFNVLRVGAFLHDEGKKGKPTLSPAIFSQLFSMSRKTCVKKYRVKSRAVREAPHDTVPLSKSYGNNTTKFRFIKPSQAYKDGLL